MTAIDECHNSKVKKGYEILSIGDLMAWIEEQQIEYKDLDTEKEESAFASSGYTKEKKSCASR